MNERHETYSNRESLEAERQRIAGMTEEEIATDLERAWREEDFPDAGLTETEKDQIYNKISGRVFGQDNPQPVALSQSGMGMVTRAWKYAAAILIPVLIMSTLYFAHQATRGIDCISDISTERGEMASITLTDGSSVRINNESTLSYNPYSFAKGERTVDLDGEAHFCVAADAAHPFTVRAGEVSVNVLGTIFNVCSRQNEDFITVLLEEGSVELRLGDSPDTYILQPWQKAVFNKLTGTITIDDSNSKDSSIAWLNHEMVFSNESLEMVAMTIERCYGVEFDRRSLQRMPDDGFTGTLPSNDISTVLDVLEDVYEVKFTLIGRRIAISD